SSAVVVLAPGLLGEDGGEQVRGLHAQELWRGAAPALVAQDREGAGRVPAPARLPHRGLQGRLLEHLAGLLRADEREDRLEGEAVLRPERQEDRIVGGRGLQLEIE